MRHFAMLLLLVSHVGVSAQNENITTLQQAYLKLEQRDLVAAEALFYQAQHELHRNEGVWTLSQLPIVDRLTEISLRSHEQKTAAQQQVNRDSISLHNFAEDSPQVAKALVNLGNYHDMMARYGQARRLYREAANLSFSDAFNTATLNLLDNQYLRGYCCNQKTILAARESVNKADSLDTTEKARKMLYIGEFAMLADKPKLGRALFRDAAQLSPDLNTELATPALLGISRTDRMERAYVETLSRSPYFDDYRHAYEEQYAPGRLIGSPMPVCAARISDLVDQGNWESYKVKLSLLITAEGRTKKVKVVETDAPGPLRLLTTRLYHLSRFRPVIENGVPVDATVEVTQTYRASTAEPTAQTPEQKNEMQASQFDTANLATTHGCHALAQRYDRNSSVAKVQ